MAAMHDIARDFKALAVDRSEPRPRIASSVRST